MNANAGEDIYQNLDVKTNNLAGIYCNSCFDEHIVGGNYGSNVGPGIKGTTCSDLTISDVHEFLSTTDNGLVMANCTNIDIVGGTYHNNFKNGIEIFKSVSSAVDGSYTTITGATVYDNSQAGNGQYSGIQIAGSTGDIANYNTVVGCVFYDDQGAKTQTYAIEESPFANFNTVTGNVMNAEATRPLFATSTNTLYENNAGLNPVGKITTFLIGGTSSVTTHTIGPYGSANSTTPIASQTYTVSVVSQFITAADSSNANNAILIKDSAGNTMLGPVHTLTAQYVPVGYTITWGAFTGTAGTVTDFGA